MLLGNYKNKIRTKKKIRKYKKIYKMKIDRIKDLKETRAKKDEDINMNKTNKILKLHKMIELLKN
jgi:hypothetical protein